MDRKVDKIIIHTSDSPDTMDIGFEEINQWHKERGEWEAYDGWIFCGYHVIVRRNGLIEVGRPDNVAGVHCKGHNATSIGIVWVGRDKMTEEQHQMLLLLVSDKMDLYGLDIKHVFGHYEFNADKTCPNLDMENLRSEIELFRMKGHLV